MNDSTRTRGGAALLIALTLLNILNFSDRYLILAFSNSIIPELHLTNLQFGLLTGVAFTAVYTVVGLFTGSLADRLNRSAVVGCGVAFWSIVSGATGLVGNFLQMVIARTLVGVGEASLTPAAVAMLADKFSPNRRALVSGVYYLGVPIGLGGSFMFAAAAGPTLGWRGSFIALGAVGVIAGLLVLLFLSDPPRVTKSEAPVLRKQHVAGERLTVERKAELRRWVIESMQEQSDARSDKPQGLRDSLRGLKEELVGNPAFRYLLIGGTAFAFINAGGILDLVWWVKERGYDEVAAQKMSGGIFLLGGIVGALLGGACADWAYRKFSAGRLRFLAWAALASFPLMVCYRLVPGHSPTFYALALSNGAFALLMFGPIFAAIQELVTPEHRASAIALFLLCAGFIGVGGGNAAVGLFADLFSSSDAPITYATLVMTAGCLISVPAFFAAARHHARKRVDVPLEDAVVVG